MSRWECAGPGREVWAGSRGSAGERDVRAPVDWGQSLGCLTRPEGNREQQPGGLRAERIPRARLVGVQYSQPGPPLRA